MVSVVMCCERSSCVSLFVAYYVENITCDILLFKVMSVYVYFDSCVCTLCESVLTVIYIFNIKYK